MTDEFRSNLLRANALYLFVAASGGLAADLLGAFAGVGPQQVVLGHAPHAAIGFVEAHGLALIFSFLLWHAESSRLWHATAAAIHVLLGTSNLVFWPIFPAANMLVGGYVTTTLHGLFAVLQGAAVLTLSRRYPQQA